MPLARRKRALRSVIPQRSPHLLYVDHVESEGECLFELACTEDLEGIVAKPKHGRYRLDGAGWIKIKNRRYSRLRAAVNSSTRIKSELDVICTPKSGHKTV